MNFDVLLNLKNLNEVVQFSYFDMAWYVLCYHNLEQESQNIIFLQKGPAANAPAGAKPRGCPPGGWPEKPKKGPYVPTGKPRGRPPKSAGGRVK